MSSWTQIDAEDGWSEARFRDFEAAHPAGATVQEIVDAFGSKGDRLTEATFRKYVQLGLLPRSVRVGAKGKNKGSQGLYPATVVRRVHTIRRLMGQGYTIEEIQKELLFIRGDIEELSRSLTRVYEGIERALVPSGQTSKRRGGRVGAVAGGGVDELMQKKFEEARRFGDALLEALAEIEQRASLRARLRRAQV